jgi:hypothetical protein
MSRDIIKTENFYGANEDKKLSSERSYREAAAWMRKVDCDGIPGIARVAIFKKGRIVGYEVKEEVYIK